MESAPKHFTEMDAEKLVGLLNFVATNGTFNNLKIKDIIAFNRMLTWAQTELLVKLQANIFQINEIKQVKKAPK